MEWNQKTRDARRASERFQVDFTMDDILDNWKMGTAT
jgi:hypothetical protein